MIRQIVFALAFLASPALAQTVQQEGSITPGHVARWTANGVIVDGGSSGIAGISSVGVGVLNIYTALQAGGAAGITATAHVKGSDGNNCALTFTFGILTTNTCP